MQPTAHILVVDDDSAIRTMITTGLQEQGFVVSSAANGAEALTEVATDQPDLILLDLEMPVMDGWSFFRRLRSTGDRTPVIIVSASGARRAQRELHAEAALSKPFEFPDLLSRVSGLVPQ